MIEFKQIIGRGTRLFEGKEFFTIYDFVDAYTHFLDPEWDGEPLVPLEEPDIKSHTQKLCKKCGNSPCICKTRSPEECQKCDQIPCICKKKVKVKLSNGKELEIEHMMQTSFWNADGKPISSEEFLNNLFGELPNFFKNESELRAIWSDPATRKTLLQKLEEAGFGLEELNTLKKLIDAEKSDLFDVLEYVSNTDIKPMTRQQRVSMAEANVFETLDEKQKEFIEFVLSQYIEIGVEELDQSKLPTLLKAKYQSLEDAKSILGEFANIGSLFINFQKFLYQKAYLEGV